MEPEPEKIPTINLPIDLLLVFAFSIIGIVLALSLPDGNIMRLIFGIPLLLFLPGYSLVSALWPGNSQISLLERLVLATGLSIVIVIIFGLFIVYFWELALTPLLIILFAFIILTLLLSLYQRSQLSEDESFNPAPHIKSFFEFGEKKEDRIFAIVISVLIVLGLVTMSYLLLFEVEGENYTEFYIIGQNNTVESLPKTIIVGNSSEINVGIVCHEYAATDYSVTIELLNITGARPNQTLDSYDITLNHKEMDERLFAFDVDQPGEYMMALTLYMSNSTEPYRELHFWVDAYEI